MRLEMGKIRFAYLDKEPEIYLGTMVNKIISSAIAQGYIFGSRANFKNLKDIAYINKIEEKNDQI